MKNEKNIKNFLTRVKISGNIARHSRRAGAAEGGRPGARVLGRRPEAKRTLKIKQRRKTRIKKPLKII